MPVSRCGALVILEATPHYRYKGRLYAYGPYVREINLWLQLVNRPAIVVAPLANTEPSAIDLPYEALSVELKPLPRFSIVDVWQMVRTLALLPFVTAKILRAMRQAVHIHVRCPSNIGLLGLVLQVFFPRIPKTVKYAGNWHKYSGEPWSYRLQKLLARSPLWCRRTRVLVYGPDAGERAHVVSSFAASYTEADARSPLSIRVPSRNGEVRLLFVGALASHKRPIVAVEACGQLRKSGITARLDLLGDGPERERIEQYVAKYGLQGVVVCHGAVSSGVVTEHQRNAHFLLLLSESEGWPKAVSEAMFWGTCLLYTS
ncbi:MAG: glycosyltransferase, partial [Kiritimatiellae bacterium]|nr:glycosyltransferase [Kiritimatiellia bacterium]